MCINPAANCAAASDGKTQPRNDAKRRETDRQLNVCFAPYRFLSEIKSGLLADCLFERYSVNEYFDLFHRRKLHCRLDYL